MVHDLQCKSLCDTAKRIKINIPRVTVKYTLSELKTKGKNPRRNKRKIIITVASVGFFFLVKCTISMKGEW